MSTNTISETLHVQGMFEDYFLEYASYVITDRAVPYLDDGLKPVQRRILHSLHEMEDGRLHKAANIIGNTMKYHPHGDAAIRDALVYIAQKDLLIDTQGNWGDPITGDSAAAPRYIECRLSKFALEVAFNKKTTQWQNSYDGRNREPVTLPMKFPLVLAQGAEGIAVGLSTRILPHNFIELLKCCIKILKKEDFQLFPDFPTGGFADVSEYIDGKQGSRVKVRAKIEISNKIKALIIREIPYGTTTASLMESVVAANDKGKIKIKRIEDNTAKNVELVIHLSPGAEPEKTIDALYAFTDCEVSLAPSCCVIRNRQPCFIGVSEMLVENVKDTVALLKAELNIRQSELEEKWHMRSLEQIFIEERIYRKIEKCETWPSIIQTIREGLEPFSKKFIRPVTDDDITRLTEIRIKRITRYDANKAQEEMIALEKDLKEVKKNLRNLTQYAISYYENILEKYGKGRERKTRLTQFEEIARSEVILSNLKVGIDRENGFVGTAVRCEDHIPNCSKMDDIIVFTEDGQMVVTRVQDKVYVGKGIIYAGRFEKVNDHIVYNLIYRDGRLGPVYLKRFCAGGITRDKQYPLTRSKEHSKVYHFSISSKVTTEKVLLRHMPKPRIKKELVIDMSNYDVKGRGSSGNIVTKHAVRSCKTTQQTAPPRAPAPEKEIPLEAAPAAAAKSQTAKKAASDAPAAPAASRAAEQPGRPLFWDKKKKIIGYKVTGEEVCRLEAEDRVLIMYNDGSYITYEGQDMLDAGDGIIYINRWDPDRIFTAVYLDGNSFNVYGKRFQITSPTEGKYYYFISDYEESVLQFLTADQDPVIDITMKPLKGSKAKKVTMILDNEHVPLNKLSHIGERLTTREVKSIQLSRDGQLSFI